MNYNVRDILEYTIALVSEFAKRFQLSDIKAYRYLKTHKAIEFVEQHYGIMHTLSFTEAVESLAIYCRKTGGTL